MLVVPEFILHDTVERLVEFIRTNFVTAETIEQSFIYQLTNTVGFERYGYYEQAKTVLIDNGVGSPRELNIQLGFNIKHNKVPSIHIVMPSESDTQNAIGTDEGSFNLSVEDIDPSYMYRNVYARRYNAIYDIVIFSDNLNEVVMLYHIFKSLIVSSIPHLDASGLNKVRITGSDLSPYMELAPKELFSRAIRLSFEYEEKSLSLYTDEFRNGIDFSVIPIND